MATRSNTRLAAIVGGNISAARNAKGWTQMDLAARLGTSISRVSGWECGDHVPRGNNQAALAEQLFEGDLAAMFRSSDSPEDVAA